MNKKKEKAAATGSIPVRATKKPNPGVGFKDEKITRTKNRTHKGLLLSEFFKEKYQMQVYTTPVLREYKNEWFVEYKFINPSTLKFKRFKERFNINRIKDLDEKRKYGQDIVMFLKQKLKSGFNPFDFNDSVKNVKTLTEHILFLKKYISKTASEHEKSTFVTMTSRLLKFAEHSGYNNLSGISISVSTAVDFRDYLVCKGLAKKTINSTLSHLSMYWDIMIEKNMVVANPFKTVPRVKKEIAINRIKPDLFEPLSFSEVEKVFSYYKTTKQYGYFAFLSMIFLAWARPVEICKLRIQDIIFSDNGQDFIKFPREITKNTKQGMVQIVPQLKTILTQLNLDQYNQSFYLFSSKYLPGSRKLDPQSPSDKWHDDIIARLAIEKKMYALKHTGNIQYLMNNKGKVDLKWQQMQNRHSSPAMTERYNRKLGAYFINTTEIKFNGID